MVTKETFCSQAAYFHAFGSVCVSPPAGGVDQGLTGFWHNNTFPFHIEIAFHSFLYMFIERVPSLLTEQQFLMQ